MIYMFVLVPHLIERGDCIYLNEVIYYLDFIYIFESHIETR